MVDRIGLRTAKFERSKSFFTQAFAPLEIKPAVEYPGGVGFFDGGTPEFWVGMDLFQGTPLLA